MAKKIPSAPSNLKSKTSNLQSLRALMVEDSEDDALLIIRELKKGGYNPVYERVETAAAMKKALKEKQWNIILCDYKLPKFNGEQAIALLKETNIDIPLIIVSGTIGEEMAVECMRLGAQDYIMKNNLSRLCPAVARELEEAEVRNKQRQAENALRESEEKYRNLVERANDGIGIAQDGILRYANAKLAQIGGYSVHELIGKPFTVFFFPEEVPKILDRYKRRIAGKKVTPVYETVLKHNDGSRIDVEVNAGIITYEGKPADLVMVRNITERKLVEEKILHSEKRFKTLYQENPIPTFTWQKKGDDFVLVDFNSAAILLTEGKASNFMGKSALELYRKRPEIIDDMLRCFKKQSVISRELVSEDFAPGRFLSVYYSYISPDLIISHVEDITERKLVQEEMVRKSKEIADLYNNAPCGYHSLGTDGTILRINDTELNWLGYNRDEVIGKKKWTDFMTPAGCLIFKKTFPILKNQKWVKNIEYDLVRRDGSVFPVLLNATVVIDEKGNYVESRSTCFDMTERKLAEEERRRLEAELFQSQKMEAVGTLAGGIAHDLNNILGGILGYTELVLTTHITQNHPARKYMDGVLRGIDRACDLVSHINTFSRQGEKQRKLIGLGPVIKEALKLIKATLPAKIEMRQRITDVERTIFADPTQMHQVVMNLCTNAAHAMKEKGGILEVSLSQITFGTDDAVFHPDLKTGIEYELLIVRDTGAGIDPENIGRIFDPFFTTKKPGEGTGLGLSVVYGIIKSHDGVICVESEPGQGSTFRVYIPTIIAAREGKNEQIDEAIPGGSERIMFVDDETTLTTIFKIQFESLGYSVDVYNDPLEALAAFQKEPQSFALVTTDMAMPHMTGIDLARELTQIRPDFPVILCTGAVEELDQELLHSLGVRRLIIKPIFTKDLARAVRQVLDGEDQY